MLSFGPVPGNNKGNFCQEVLVLVRPDSLGSALFEPPMTLMVSLKCLGLSGPIPKL